MLGLRLAMQRSLKADPPHVLAVLVGTACSILPRNLPPGQPSLPISAEEAPVATSLPPFAKTSWPWSSVHMLVKYSTSHRACVRGGACAA